MLKMNTNIVWHPVAVYFLRRGAMVYVVNPRMSADLARFYNRYATSDRLAAKVLARLPLIIPDKLYPLVLSGADYLALQRGCKELDRLTTQASAIKNRLQAIDHLGWPDLKQRVFSNSLGPPARWFRDHFYEPHQVIEAGAGGLRRAWQAAEEVYNDDEEEEEEEEDWSQPLVALAKEVQSLYGDQGTYLNYAPLAAEVSRDQRRLAELEADAHFVRLNITRPLYRKLHPSRRQRRGDDQGGWSGRSSGLRCFRRPPGALPQQPSLSRLARNDTA